MHDASSKRNPDVSRRFFLKSAPAIGMIGSASAVGMTTPTMGQSPPSASFAIFASSFTLDERERRWSSVRAIMVRPSWNLDAIITLGSALPGNYSRYLTQIANRLGNAGAGSNGQEVIFPRDPALPTYAHVGSGRARAIWTERVKSWTSDGKLVVVAEDGPEALAKQLMGMGLNKAGTRIGVGHVAGSRFATYGLASEAAMDVLPKDLPGVVFVPIDRWGQDGGPREEASWTKGPEELEAIRRSVAAAETGLTLMVAAIKAGATRQAEIWWACYSAMFMRTGEDPTRCSIGLNEPSNATIGEPTGDRIGEGQIVSQEIDATVQGYRAQINHSVFVGNPSTPGFEYYKAAADAVVTILNDGLAFLKPGQTLRDFTSFYMQRVEALGADDTSDVMLHSSGIGDLSRPQVGPQNSVKDLEIMLRPGMTFDFKPTIRFRGATMQDVSSRNREVQIGEHVLITETGAIRLGSRPLTPLTT